MEEKVIAENKRVLRNFEIIDTIEAGIELKGYEVKSVRNDKMSLEGSFIKENNGEFFIHKMFIAGNPSLHAKGIEKRKRKLLLHKNEIVRLSTRVKERGFTIIPIDVHTSDNRIKLKVALVKHKRLYGNRRKIEEKRLEEETRKARRSG